MRIGVLTISRIFGFVCSQLLLGEEGDEVNYGDWTGAMGNYHGSYEYGQPKAM